MFAQAWHIEKRVGTTLTTLLPLAGLGDLGGDAGAGLATGLVAEGGAFACDGQVQVDAVEQRARELVAVALDLLGAAPAAGCRVAQVAAHARST